MLSSTFSRPTPKFWWNRPPKQVKTGEKLGDKHLCCTFGVPGPTWGSVWAESVYSALYSMSPSGIRNKLKSVSMSKLRMIMQKNTVTWWKFKTKRSLRQQTTSCVIDDNLLGWVLRKRLWSTNNYYMFKCAINKKYVKTQWYINYQVRTIW